jgi:hypothetical protein
VHSLYLMAIYQTSEGEEEASCVRLPLMRKDYTVLEDHSCNFSHYGLW